MFEYSLIHWTTFFSAALLLNLCPGPDMAFIVGQTASSGKQGGFAAMFGIWTGAFLHVILAALGLSAILATSAVAFSIVKWAGALYLLYLGIQAILAKDTSFLANEEAKRKKPFSIFRQGVLVAALNPKVAIFFLAFLPQFIVQGAGPAGAQLFLHGSLIIVVAALVEPPLVLVGSACITRLKNNSTVASTMEKGLGALFIALGIRLALSEHR